ncbi:unnamed protein product [Brassica napus]|uniref:(rape) hypothetical protein n=1 Tax=Brassica napus TaxID=3708 RepID=A0A816JQ20_BRANA|nr:unnamed protein product [Brassica napus]
MHVLGVYSSGLWQLSNVLTVNQNCQTGSRHNSSETFALPPKTFTYGYYKYFFY